MDKNKKLLKACEKGDLKKVQTLIKDGADVNYQNVKSFNVEDWVTYLDGDKPRLSFNSPLMKAAKNGHLKVVEFLVTTGADVNLINRFDQNAVWRAAEKNHFDVVKFLVENGADVKHIRLGVSTLLWAAGSNNKKVVGYLVAKGATVYHIKYYSPDRYVRPFWNKMGPEIKQYFEEVFLNSNKINPMNLQPESSLLASKSNDKELSEVVALSNNDFQPQPLPKSSAPSM